MNFELNTCLKIPLRRRYMPGCETNHPQDVRIWCYICVSDLLSFLTCYSVDDMLAMRTFLSVQLCHCHPSHTPVSLQAWWWILDCWRDLCYCSFCRPLLPLTLEIISIALKKQCNQAIKFNTWKQKIFCCRYLTKFSFVFNEVWFNRMEPGYLVTKMTPFYSYKNSHHKRKTVWRPSQVYDKNPYNNKAVSS